MGLVALMVGLAGLLLIGYNWSAMPGAVKPVIIFGTIVGTHTGGFYLRLRKRQCRLSEVVFFLGCLFYGGGIWLLRRLPHQEDTLL